MITTLTIIRRENELEIKDNPGVFWEFYFSFIVGGAVALIMALCSTRSGWPFFLTVFVSVASILAGLILLKRDPASIIRFDITDKIFNIKRWTLFGSSKIPRSLDDIKQARLDTRERSDGKIMFRPVLVLLDESIVPISNFWHKLELASLTVVQEVNSYLASGPSHK